MPDHSSFESIVFTWVSYQGEWEPVLSRCGRLIGFRAVGTDCFIAATGLRDYQSITSDVAAGQIVRINGNVLTIPAGAPAQKDAA